MILFLYGEDTFRSRQHIHKIMEKFRHDRDPQGLNIARLDCEKEPAERILQDLFAAPFLAEKRMLVLENLLVSKQEELRQTFMQKIKDDALPDTTVLVFWEGEHAPKTKDGKALYTRLQKEKFAQEFAVLPPAKLAGWIAQETAARGGHIDTPAAQYLAQHTAGDMWRLHALIDQLIAYRWTPEQNKPDEKTAPTLPRHITFADVQLFLDEKIDNNIFGLVDAIVAK